MLLRVRIIDIFPSEIENLVLAYLETTSLMNLI